MRLVCLFLICLAGSACAAASLRITRPAVYQGMCDASAAVAVSSNLFLVASDEDNVLRLYRREQPGPPVKTFDLNAFLEITGKSPEADLEAATAIGSRAFWIGSHGRNKNAKERLNRHRLFATDIRCDDHGVSLEPVGRPCKTLLEQLLQEPRFDQFQLGRAAEKMPNDPGALNIEGLAATPEGHLLIGFRNPIPGRQALLIPLLNPNDVVTGARARFGDPIRLDLGGLGIRDLTRLEDTYWIIAGPYHSGKGFQVYRWKPATGDLALVRVKHLNRYHPEAIIHYPEDGPKAFQILSDDGSRLVDSVPGKRLSDPSRQTFRSFWLEP